MQEDSSVLGPSELEQVPPDSASEEGYSFSITISPQGFTVDGEDVADLATVLKHVIAIVKEHENSSDAIEQMSQGYQASHSPMQSPAPL